MNRNVLLILLTLSVAVTPLGQFVARQQTADTTTMTEEAGRELEGAFSKPPQKSQVIR